jgi:MipA family protein
MKRITLVSIVAAMCVYAQEDSTKIGLGVVSTQQPYKGTKGRVLVLPYFEAHHKGFYFRGLEAGYEQKIDDDFSLGAFAKGRLDGYKGSDSDDLSQMQERKYALEAGAKASFSRYQIGKISAFASSDVSGVHNGYELGVEYSRMHIYEKSIFIPFISLKRESKELTDYYYGVRKSEITAQRPEYSTNGALNAEIGVRYIYNLSKNIGLISAASYTRLDESIHKSPIVKDKGRLKAFVSCGYKF